MASPQNSSGPPAKALHTCAVTAAQAEKLRALLLVQGWDFETRPYMLFFAKNGKLTVAAYEKGPKLVIQGKGVEDFVRFTLEPEVTGEAVLGYEEVHHPDWFAPHFGVDESGKGDFFGPLVIAGAYVDETIARHWRAGGIQDSKKIGSDVRIRQLATLIRETPGAVTNVVMIGPERYNELYRKFGNLNRLLAWGHARVIENLLEMKPCCPRALSDQFANPVLIQRALLEKGRGIQLDQRTKAESDPAVAAASVLAREAFVEWMDQTGRAMGTVIPKGASAAVKEAGRRLVRQHGNEVLNRVSKVHFKTAAEIMNEFSETERLPGSSEVV